MSARKICDECAGVPVDAQHPPDAPRRAPTAEDGSLVAVLEADRRPPRPARLIERAPSPASGSPACFLVAVEDDRDAHAVLSAGRLQGLERLDGMITSPPFMSMTPGPRAWVASTVSNLWNGFSGSKTVSRCPMSRSCGPVPGARRSGAPRAGTTRRPPSGWRSPARRTPRSTSPTARTPARFMVPLLMFTSRSSSARPSALCASTCRTRARSTGRGSRRRAPPGQGR